MPTATERCLPSSSKEPASGCGSSWTVIGCFLFYGIGMGLGLSLGLVYVELTALAVFVFQTLLCRFWLRYFRFGPLEWLWRLGTYGHYFPIAAT